MTETDEITLALRRHAQMKPRTHEQRLIEFERRLLRMEGILERSQYGREQE